MSPYIKHRIDLCAAGFEDNPHVNISLADKRRAFDDYRMKWDAFHLIKKWERAVDNPNPDHQVRGPGVYGFVVGPPKFIEFLSLESVSRGVPPREWKVPLPDFELLKLAINPHADLLVVIEGKAR
jgi:hypothetical protein